MPATKFTAFDTIFIIWSFLNSIVLKKNAEAERSVGHSDDSQVQTILTKLVNYKSEQKGGGGSGELSCLEMNGCQ